jgi:hypothetical protein
MRFHRRMTFMVLAGLLACATAASATPLAPFINLQEQGLTLSQTGKGLMGWSGGPENLTVNIGGPVRFALLYWGGRERPCTLDASGTNCPFTQPYKDQQMVFNGTPVTGTVIGTETQPQSAGGPIFNIGYYADVTGIVSAAGTGSKTFTISDGNGASNLWRLDGAGLIVGYRDAANPAFYRVVIWDGMDFAYGDDPTPGDNRVTAPANLNHGAQSVNRTADLYLLAGDGEASRPDNTTVSNNPTFFNILNSAAGPQFNSEIRSITIPANTSVTTVQMNSAPAGQNPDSLLWLLVALRVGVPNLSEVPPGSDSTPPSCPARVVAGPPTQLIVTFQDTESGLSSLVVTQSDNADTVVPPFAAGTTDPVTVTATKINQSQPAHVAITATDLDGNVAACDPVIALYQRDPLADPRATFGDIPQAENKLLIMNGTRGLKNFEATVNGQRFKVTGLKDGEQRTIDISSAMLPGNNNVVAVTGHGPKDSFANVVVWDQGANQ